MTRPIAQRKTLINALYGLFMFLWFPSAVAESICAVVKIEIRQELTFERQGFEAHMRISNDLDTLALESLAIDVLFEDEDGNPVQASYSTDNSDAAFFIRIWSMEGVDAVDGTGTVAPNSKADIRWLIVPAPGSGGHLPSGKLYFVGARLSYLFGGEERETEVTPDFIYVRPLPELSIDYFLTEDVFADDPLTEDVIEPVEPFTLGVRVRNNGDGPARRVKIESAQPEIVENEQGLLIDFRITGSSVNDQPSIPSLLVDLGDIAPGGATVARWTMETTLSGQFVDFHAEFSHDDELGGELTSIIDQADTHFLIHDVLVDLPGRDRIRDFLALDGDTLRVYESHGLDTEVTDQSSQSQLLDKGDDRYEIITPITQGFIYVKLPDPFQANKQVAQAFRSDGKQIATENIWFSKERDRDNDTWKYFFNLFDINSNGFYTLAVEDRIVLPQPPAMQFIPDRRIHEGGRLGFIVEASDPNGTVPMISTTPLPSGATLDDETVGQLARYAFDWPVEVGQALTAADGTYRPYQITFTASDGVLETSQLVEILVCPFWDTDCDRMADAWEMARFGSLERDGTGDFDGDGVSDLDEYLNGTEIVINFRSGVNYFNYPYAVPAEHASCRLLLSELSAGGVDDSLSRFNSLTQTYETCSQDDGIDFPIVTGEGYQVNLATETDLLLTGTAVCDSPDVQPGLNLRGHTFPPGGLTCYGWLRAFGAQRVSSIQHLNPATGRFEICSFDRSATEEMVVGFDFPIIPGEGYLIHAQSAASGVLPGCAQ